MIIRSSLILLLLTGLVACKSKSALAYSEAIVKIERSLTAEISRTEDKIAALLKMDRFDSAALVSERMENLLDAKLKEVEKLEPPRVKEADSFRKAAIRYFTYMKSVYTSYKDYFQQTTDEDRAVKGQELVSLVNDKEVVVENMQRAQLKYARANGFSIDGSK